MITKAADNVAVLKIDNNTGKGKTMKAVEEINRAETISKSGRLVLGLLWNTLRLAVARCGNPLERKIVLGLSANCILLDFVYFQVLFSLFFLANSPTA